MIAILGLVTVAASALLRLVAGEFGPLVPATGLAWTVLLARRSLGGAFVGAAVVFGMLDGLTVRAPFLAVPISWLLVGLIVHLTRPVLPVRRFRGETIIGVVVALAGMVLVGAFTDDRDPLDTTRVAWPLRAASALITGALCALLTDLAERWPALRHALWRR